MDAPEITLSEYWRIIRKRKTALIVVLFLVVGSTIIFTKLQTPVYEASLEIKIERQNPITVSTTGQSLTGIDSSINLATEMQFIKSLTVMSKVVEKMEVLPADPEVRSNTIHVLSLSYQGRINVGQIRGTDILTISAVSSDPKNAALLATATADVYIVENVEGRKKQSLAQIAYIDKQLKKYKGELAENEILLQKFKQNEKVFEVTPKVKFTLMRLTIAGTFEFETQMLKLDSELRKLKKLIAERQKESRMDLSLKDTFAENFIFIGLKRRLLELEFNRFLLLIDYTEMHPMVKEKDTVIAEVKAKIVDMVKSYVKQPLDLQGEADLSLVIKQMFQGTRREVLFRIVNKFYEESGSLSSNQLEYLGLTRNIDRLLNSYDALIKQKEEINLNLARVIDDVVNIVSPASPPKKPIKPNMKINFIVSLTVGFMLGIMACFIKESVDNSVSTIADVEQELKLNMLGIVPHMKKEEVLIGKEEDYDMEDKKLLYQQLRLVTVMHPKSWPAESIKMLRTNIDQIMKSNDLKSLLFTSSDKQEGKSTLVTNIALSMAQLGKRTVLVGSNMRRPTAYKIFGLERGPGLSDILMGHISWKEAINTSIDVLTGGLDIDKLLQMPGIDNFRIITAGRPVDNVSELLNSKSYDTLMNELKEHFDVIIIDCSPVMAVPDAITLSDKVDGVILVYKVSQTGKDVLKMAKTNLLNAKANILGVVLNNIKTEAEVGYSAYYYRYYAESGEKKGGVLNKWKNQFEKSEKSQNDITRV